MRKIVSFYRRGSTDSTGSWGSNMSNASMGKPDIFDGITAENIHFLDSDKEEIDIDFDIDFEHTHKDSCVTH